MPGDQKSLSLSTLAFSKLPLRYGTEFCYITLTDGHFTAETVQLRNTQALGKYINYVELTAQSHERWLAEQLERDDALNFALVAKGRFAGTLSLYDIKHGESCEFGRMMMPDDGRRIFALAAEMLGMSFAFEILGIRTLYCVVMEGNNAVLNFHLKNGWSRDARYERFEQVNGLNAHLIGLSMDRSEWPQCFARMRPLAKRLLAPAQVGAL
jgi:RimJ/RimL family protein N-acetyltransferase